MAAGIRSDGNGSLIVPKWLLGLAGLLLPCLGVAGGWVLSQQLQGDRLERELADLSVTVRRLSSVVNDERDARRDLQGAFNGGVQRSSELWQELDGWRERVDISLAGLHDYDNDQQVKLTETLTGIKGELTQLRDAVGRLLVGSNR